MRVKPKSEKDGDAKRKEPGRDGRALPHARMEQAYDSAGPGGPAQRAEGVHVNLALTEALRSLLLEFDAWAPGNITNSAKERARTLLDQIKSTSGGEMTATSKPIKPIRFEIAPDDVVRQLILPKGFDKGVGWRDGARYIMRETEPRRFVLAELEEGAK